MLANTATTPFQQALDLLEQLPPTDREGLSVLSWALMEIVRQRLLEQRRQEIAANAEATLRALHEGRASYGTIEDLSLDLGH